MTPNEDAQGSTSDDITPRSSISTLPPDNGMVAVAGPKRAYISVVVLCFINLINYMDRYTLAGVLTDVKGYYGLDNSEAGLLQTSFIISYMIMAPIFGYLGDRYNRKRIMAYGVAFWSVTTYLGSCIPSGYFGWFLLLRALVGTGEASYSTIAPTVIADLFTGSMRTKMLALFYFAIPVGSGLGYIVGSEVANLFGHWYWALRVTPVLGILTAIFSLTVLVEPPRGEAEGGVNMKNSSVIEDVVAVLKIPSFIWVTVGFTCVTFSVGALAWWVPDFMMSAIKVGGGKAEQNSVSLVFGIITCFAGIVGVLLGTGSAQFYRRFNPRADPLICAYSMLGAVPVVFFGCVLAYKYIALSYVLIFFGVTLLCMNWVIVADIVLYVVIPTRRSMAEAIQITLSHALGDACSPYVVGAISDAIKKGRGTAVASYTSMEYALFLPVFVLVLGAVCFLINSKYILEDKEKCEKITHGQSSPALHLAASGSEINQSIDSYSQSGDTYRDIPDTLNLLK